MTDAAMQSSFVKERAPAQLPRQRLEPIRALKALRKLLADKDDTGQVFEIMQAMNGRSIWKGYTRLLSTREGGRLAYERLELHTRLNDPAFMASLPEGSVGAAYRDFLGRSNLTAEGLAEISRDTAAKRGLQAEMEHPIAWFGRRIRDSHDIWHTLTGYGTDALGELCLVAFSYGQTRSLGWAVIAVGGALRALGMKDGMKVVAAVREGYRRGRDAAWLPGQDMERLLREPLEAARARLGLTPPSAYLATPTEWRTPYVALPALATA